MLFLNHNFCKFLRISGIFALLFVCTLAHAGPTPFSQYGMIQNVQNYSSNPFYTPGVYGAAYPKIAYNSGPALKPADCQVTVSTLIQNICATRNNCRNTTLADIRPEIMVALSKLPTYNYASSCAGYIDEIYKTYTNNNTNTGNVTPTSFPSGTSITVPTKPQTEYEKRASELKALQQQTKNSTDNIVATEFPKTFDDLSFTEKNEIKRAGYEPYKDAQVYIPLNIERDKNAYKSTTEAEQEVAQNVAFCIQQYGTQEQAAEDAFFQAYNKTHKIPKTDALKTAIVNAITSACKCTENLRFTASIRATLGVQCPISDAETTAQQYIDNLVSQLGV